VGNDDHGELAVKRRLELLARSDAGGDGDCECLHHRVVGARARHVKTVTHATYTAKEQPEAARAPELKRRVKLR